MQENTNDVRKELFLRRFKAVDPNWEDGDKTSKHKTADLIHQDRKIAIELKIDETYSKPINSSQSNDLSTLSNRYKGYVKSANKKFSYYPDYRSLLVIETQLILTVFESVFNGLSSIEIPTGISRQVNRYFSNDSGNIGHYAVGSFTDGKIRFFPNPYALSTKVISENELQEIFTSIGIPINNLEF